MISAERKKKLTQKFFATYLFVVPLLSSTTNEAISRFFA